MTRTPAQLLSSYLEDAIAAEKAFESRLREFSSEGDDDDVKNAFATAAEQSRIHSGQLSDRLQAAGLSGPSATKIIVADLFGIMPQSAQLARVQEERTVQNLVMTYTLAAGACAMYESLSTIARAAGDVETYNRTREMQKSQSKLAEKLFHFIPTRSIIAYNMLTLDEVDPSVQTKLGEASWT